MSNDNDFVNLPLRKQTNRENPLSRIERLEKRTGARSSATVGQLSQLAGKTGDLVVDGSIVVVNRDDGAVDITIDDGGITVRNQEGDLSFEDTSGITNNIQIYSDGADDLVLKNAVGGKGIRMDIDNASHSVGGPSFTYDGIFFGDDTLVNGFQISNAAGVETAFNDGGLDINFRIESDGDADNFFSDGGANRVGIGTSSPGSKLDVAGSFQCDSITNDTGLAAGTYSPTVTAVTNVDSASADADFMYTRVGNIVTGYGSVSIDPTAGSGTTRIEISLPIASNFAAATDAVGGGSAQVTNTTGNISADTTDDRLALQFQSPTTASMAWRIWFMYQIL
jgi:hypothetical protein